jgi:hypothetical protein
MYLLLRVRFAQCFSADEGTVHEKNEEGKGERVLYFVVKNGNETFNGWCHM